MKELLLLTDYKDRFGNKHGDIPYRSGMNKELLRSIFTESGFKIKYLQFKNLNFRNPNFVADYILYTSQEDNQYFYKSYIENIILGLTDFNLTLIPNYKFLIAHSNKVYMEILREHLGLDPTSDLKTKLYGSFQELERDIHELEFPLVIKSAGGANSKGVCLAKSEHELRKKSYQISRTRNLYLELWELGRSIKYKSYRKESGNRRKFITQRFIDNLENDWKVYVFGDKYYIFNRPILRKEDFRASGGGYENYYYGSKAQKPEGLLDFAKQIHEKLHVPHSSLDIAYDGKKFYLFEFQAIYFGTAGILFSDCYYKKTNQGWDEVYEKLSIEKVYADSIMDFINKNEGSISI